MVRSVAQVPGKFEGRRRPLWVALVFFVLGCFVLLAYIGWFSYRDTRADAETRARNYAELVVARLDATLQRIDADMVQLAARIPDELFDVQASEETRRALERDMERYRQGLPEAGIFKVADAQGNLLDTEPAINIADRPYFSRLRGASDTPTVFSELVVSRLDSRPAMVAAHAIRDSDGKFLGALILPLNLAYFKHLFDSVKLGTNGELLIRRVDNHQLIMQLPTKDAEVARRQLGRDVAPRVLLTSGNLRGVLDFVSPLDDVRRIYAYHVLEHYPFYVLAGVSSAEVWVAWWQRIAALAGVSFILFSGLGVVLFNMFRSQEREQAALASQRQMESRLQLLASAFQCSGEAILISDHNNNIVTVNPAFTRLTGYSEADACGRNPRFLSSGQTTQEVYREMWRGITERDFWQGEIWDRRKDGGTYPKWVTISVIRDGNGQLSHYIAHFTDVSMERAAEEQLQHMAHHDVLTGLLNRLSLKLRLDQVLAAARRDGRQLALLFIDLDRFKVINDTLGHHIGDKLLIEVASRLRDSVRDSDIVARLGGDEFVIMLSGMDNASSAALIAEKLVRNIGDPYLIDDYDLYTSPSIGIAIFPNDGEDGDMLMKNADAAMYHAKAAGRNNFQFFDARMNDAALDRLKIEHSLRQALARGEFCVHYQPIIDMTTGRVSAVEALVRWQHPEMGMLAPGSFIGIAEETGLIQPIGEWVFWTACRQLSEFNAAGFCGLKMSINISAMQLRNGNLPILVKGAIEAFSLEPTALVFEITESVAMQQPEETARILNLLSAMGIGLAIDDFGTGYSSLSYLRLFPIKHLKLDRSFVQEIGLGPGSSVICDATIALAHNLGLELVAEGVETQAQYEHLRQKGCDLIQGYLFSRPIPAAEALEFIRQHN